VPGKPSPIPALTYHEPKISEPDEYKTTIMGQSLVKEHDRLHDQFKFLIQEKKQGSFEIDKILAKMLDIEAACSPDQREKLTLAKDEYAETFRSQYMSWKRDYKKLVHHCNLMHRHADVKKGMKKLGFTFKNRDEVLKSMSSTINFMKRQKKLSPRFVDVLEEIRIALQFQPAHACPVLHPFL
jgi:rhodanese-related sulfurtransferase